MYICVAAMETNDPISDPQALSELPIALANVTSRPREAGDLEPGQQGLQEMVERAAFMDAVLSNPAFLQSLSTQEILLVKCVCRSWAAWFADSAATIADARRQDETRDWYFPLFYKPLEYGTYGLGTGILDSTHLSGMWHASAEFSSDHKLSNLPPMTYLAGALKRCICNVCPNDSGHIIVASAGGLLLLMFDRATEDNQWGNGDHTNECMEHSRNRNQLSLIVTNPLSQQFKALPEFEGCGPRHEWFSNCDPPYLNIVVDDKANTYKVLVFWCYSHSPPHIFKLAVYDSKSNKWQSVHDIHALMQPSLGMLSRRPVFRTLVPRNETMYCAVAYLRGRLYVADTRDATQREKSMNVDVSRVIRLFEANIETGRFKLQNEFPVGRVHIPSEHRVVRFPPHALYGDLCNFELIECMGHLYAVYPAWPDQFLYLPNSREKNIWQNADVKLGLGYLPLQFFVFQLDGIDEGEGRTHGILRIEAPRMRTLRLPLGAA